MSYIPGQFACSLRIGEGMNHLLIPRQPDHADRIELFILPADYMCFDRTRPAINLSQALLALASMRTISDPH